MISPEHFFKRLAQYGTHFYTGIPDSLLKSFCSYVEDHVSKKNHIIGANEGGCVGLAAGYYLSTGKIPLVYMQNSGLGNIVNPLTSLVDQEVYSLPMLLLIGHRGRPGTMDEPQHVKMGRVNLPLLECLEIPYRVLSSEQEEDCLREAYFSMEKRRAPFALVVEKGTFSPYSSSTKELSRWPLSRFDSLLFCVKHLSSDAVIISTTGHLSRELYKIRFQEDLRGKNGKKDFKVVGSMGHASQIAMGVAQNAKRNVFCFDGDGASLMHLGNLAICGQKAPKNFRHILFNNGAHGSVGGQKTIGHAIDFTAVALACGYKKGWKITTLGDLEKIWDEFHSAEGPVFLEILTNTKVENNLPRPKESPIEARNMFMNFIK